MSLKYEELRLGDIGVDMYKDGKSIEEIARVSPVYLNTNLDLLGLSVVDYAIVNNMVGGNGLIVGRSGCGKSQLAEDFSRYYFGGNIDAEGKALTIEGDPELRIMEDVFTNLSKEDLKRSLNDRVNTNYINLEELNRCPPITQNQFFALLNKRLIFEGNNVVLGNGFCPTVSTVNIGNGDYKGTFESDLALYNRFGIVLDLDSSEFKPTYEDKKLLRVLRPADSGLKKSPIRDITSKLIEDNKIIQVSTLNLGLEAEIALEFLEEGLTNCCKNSEKDVDWNIQNRECQNCEHNTTAPNPHSLCSLIQSPVSRTMNNVRLYSAGIDHLLKIKGNYNVNIKDIVFRAFELTASYSGVLNPFISQSSFSSKNSKMMKDVVEKLKQDYSSREDSILTALNSSERGIPISSLFCIVKQNGEKKIF